MSTHGKTWPPHDAEPAVPHADAPPPGTELAPHYAECFGCGAEIDSGLHMCTTVAENATVVSTFTVGKDHQGAPGLAHGGLLSCAFDEALGAAVGNLLRQPAVTASLETDFVCPVPVGTTLHIVVTVDGVAGRKVYASAEGRLNADDGAVAVRARGLFVVVRPEHFVEHGDPEALKKINDASQAVPGWNVNP